MLRKNAYAGTGLAEDLRDLRLGSIGVTRPNVKQAIPDFKSEAIDFRAASELFAPYKQAFASDAHVLFDVVAPSGTQFLSCGPQWTAGKTANDVI